MLCPMSHVCTCVCHVCACCCRWVHPYGQCQHYDWCASRVVWPVLVCTGAISCPSAEYNQGRSKHASQDKCSGFDEAAIWSRPSASGCLAERWHALVDGEAVTRATDQTQLQMPRQWQLLLPQGLPWNAQQVPQACLMHMSACSVASAI